jgi:hypothetical protein
MKRILIILIIGFVFATAHAQMDNPLKSTDKHIQNFNKS